jgi:hypothetical protein
MQGSLQQSLVHARLFSYAEMINCRQFIFFSISIKMFGVLKFVKSLVAKATKATKTLKAKKSNNRKTRKNGGLQRGG